MRSAWLFNDPCTGQWTIALDYKSQPSTPIYQYNVPPECSRLGTPCMDPNTFNANSVKVQCGAMWSRPLSFRVQGRWWRLDCPSGHHLYSRSESITLLL